MESLVTLKDAARFLGLRPDTLRRWVADAKIPAIRLTNRAIRFDPQVLREFVIARSTTDK